MIRVDKNGHGVRMPQVRFVLLDVRGAEVTLHIEGLGEGPLSVRVPLGDDSGGHRFLLAAAVFGLGGADRKPGNRAGGVGGLVGVVGPAAQVELARVLLAGLPVGVPVRLSLDPTVLEALAAATPRPGETRVPAGPPAQRAGPPHAPPTPAPRTRRALLSPPRGGGHGFGGSFRHNGLARAEQQQRAYGEQWQLLTRQAFHA